MAFVFLLNIKWSKSNPGHPCPRWHGFVFLRPATTFGSHMGHLNMSEEYWSLESELMMLATTICSRCLHSYHLICRKTKEDLDILAKKQSVRMFFASYLYVCKFHGCSHACCRRSWCNIAVRRHAGSNRAGIRQVFVVFCNFNYNCNYNCSAGHWSVSGGCPSILMHFAGMLNTHSLYVFSMTVSLHSKPA